MSGSAPIFRPLSEWSQNVVASRHSRHSFGVVSDACFARSFRPLTLRRWRSLGPHCVASLLAPARAHWALWWCSRPTARPGWMCCCTCFAAFAPHPGFGDGAAGAQIFAVGSKFCHVTERAEGASATRKIGGRAGSSLSANCESFWKLKSLRSGPVIPSVHL